MIDKYTTEVGKVVRLSGLFGVRRGHRLYQINTP